jgi:hypothetical protein
MAWWWKRQTPQTATDKTERNVDDVSERNRPRPAQPAPIPQQRDHATPLDEAASLEPAPTETAPHDRWDIIKRDLIALDPDFFTDLEQLVDEDRHTSEVHALTDERLAASLKRLAVRYLVDETGALLAMWERHVIQIRREGPGGEILVLRARAYATLPADWNERAYGAVNEWNRTRRFLKAYIGEPTESGRLPLYGETQIPLRPGLTDALLDEFIDCAAAVSGAYIDWLHDEGAVL